MRTKENKTVFVAMSGGVDSSVAAALLKRRGFDVVGVFMRNWHVAYGQYTNSCPWEEDQESARRAAAKIGIPLYTWDFSAEYKKRVVDYMVEGYSRGETPNPDVMCNKEIKFGLFLEKARRLGADYIATGHYVRKKLENRKWKLEAAVDTNKDQSYFLWTLTQEQLRYCLFPIGEYIKQEVRQMAREFGLPNAERKDSQGLCFVGKIDLPQFLASWLPEKKGAVVTTSGKAIGEHRGVQFYTIGQRHGIGIGGGTPYFVAQKDSVRNSLLVVEGLEDSALWRKEIRFSESNWISGLPAGGFPLRAAARIRYRQPLQVCMVENDGLAVFDEPQKAVAPGQSIVFYQGDEVVGGGVIR